MPTNWPKDNTAAKNAFYGNFNDANWQSKNLILIQLPYKMYYQGSELKHGIRVHRLIAPAVLAAANEIWEKCGHDQEKVNKTGASDFSGCFNIRKIADSNNWSNHSWACAIDLSAKTNGFYKGKGTMDPIVITAFKNQGFFWGGDYKGRTDPMHFEAVSR